MFFLEEVVSEESSNSDDTSDLIEEILDFPLDLKEDCEDECSGGRPRHASSSSDGTIESVDENIIDEVTAEDLDIEKKSSKTGAKETFYFYQSSDGKYLITFFPSFSFEVWFRNCMVSRIKMVLIKLREWQSIIFF